MPAAAATFSPTPVMRPVDQVRVSIVRAIATGQLRPALLRRDEINAERAAIRDRDGNAAAAAVDRHLDRLYRRAGVR